MTTRLLVILTAFFALSLPALAQTGANDVADIKSQDLRAGGNSEMRYFLIGPKAGAQAPADGYSLLVVMPGGDGSADFHVFVTRIFKYAIGSDYLVAQPVAIKWTPGQRIVWPTDKSTVDKMRFSTEEFVEAVIKDAGTKFKINPKRIFTLSWSSSGPAAYVIALQDKTAVTGSFVAMSVWQPDNLPPVANAKSRPFYIYHSPDDRVCAIRLAREAQKALSGAGAIVRFVEYPGGHGWTSGNIYPDIRAGIEWLEDPVSSPEEEKTETAATPTGALIPFTDSFETGADAPEGWQQDVPVPGVKYIYDKSIASDGKASLCLEKTVNKYLPPIAEWVKTYDYDGKSPALAVSAKVKARKMTKAIIDVQFTDAAGKGAHEWAAYIGAKNAGDPPADHDWKEYSGAVKIPAGTKKIHIGLQIYGPGKIWFDELKASYASK